MKSLKDTKYFFLLAMAVVMAVFCVPSGAQVTGGQAGDTARVRSIDTLLTPGERNSYNALFLEALCRNAAGESDTARALFAKCIEKNPDAPEAYYEMAAFYMKEGKDSLALQAFERASQLNPSNPVYMECAAEYYLRQNNMPKAIETFERLYDNNHSRLDVVQLLIQLYEKQKDYPHMLENIARIERKEGTTDNIVLAKMQVYELMGDVKSSQKAIRGLAESHPNDVTYQIMYGNWLLQKSKKKEAEKILSKALRENPDNSYAQSSMYDYYMAEGDTVNGYELRDRILLSGKTPEKMRLTMVADIIKDSESKGVDSVRTLAMLNRIINANPKEEGMREMLLAYMQLKKMPQDSIAAAIRQTLAVSPDASGPRLQLVQMQWEKKDWDNVIALCQPGMQYNPDEMAYYYFMGLAYFQKDDEDKALDTFRRGVGEINSKSNPNIVSEFYAIMGDILQKKGFHKESYAAYDSCLQWKPDHVLCLNNYAYFLSLQDTLIDKAEKMSYKTIKAEPDNTTYLDTYAWILYIQKRYSEAQIYIDQAIRCDTDSVTSGVILEHAGDIYLANGDKRKALEYWLKAQKNGGASELLPGKIKAAQKPEAPEIRKKRKK